MLFYKLYNGLYDLQFNDYFTVSAKKRRIHVTPTYKFKKINHGKSTVPSLKGQQDERSFSQPSYSKARRR